MSINKLEELEKLTELKNKGIITEAEFEFKKFELLNKVNANNILQNGSVQNSVSASDKS